MTFFRNTRGLIVACALSMPCLLGNKGCEEIKITTGDDARVCEVSECGPKPTTPGRVCADGTVSGPGACERDANGKCGYTFRECPSPEVDAGEPAADGGDAGGDSEPGLACGTEGGAQCKEGQFCKFGPDCGSADAGGMCTDKAEACTKESKPVCGCDGKTYSNECTASAAGVSVKSQGACPGGTLGAACGGKEGLVCGEGLFCDYGSQCGTSDAAGKCEEVATVCTKEMQRVCGCDGKTYGNRCLARMEGVSVRSRGACH